MFRQILARGLTACGHAIDDLIFPWTCLLCGSEEPGLHGPFCPPCRAELLEAAAPATNPRCPRCALPVGPFADLHGGCAKCRGHSLGFDAALALGTYEGPVRDLCLRLKHERNAWLAPWLCDLLVEARRAETRPAPGRRLGRAGPAPLVATAPAGLQPGRCPGRRPGPAARPPRPSPAQAGQVHGPPGPEGGDRAARSHARGLPVPAAIRGLKGRTILLVDDILTTGATSGAAARALKKAGARRVVVAVLARTV